MSKEKYTKDKEKRINLVVSKELKTNYRIFCLNNEYNMSERIRQFLEDDLKKNCNKNK